MLAPPPQLDRGALLLLAGIAEACGFALFPVEGLENLVRAQCLEPIDVARVVGPLVEALGSMSVKNRAAERGALDSPPGYGGVWPAAESPRAATCA